MERIERNNNRQESTHPRTDVAQQQSQEKAERKKLQDSVMKLAIDYFDEEKIGKENLDKLKEGKFFNLRHDKSPDDKEAYILEVKTKSANGLSDKKMEFRIEKDELSRDQQEILNKLIQKNDQKVADDPILTKKRKIDTDGAMEVKGKITDPEKKHQEKINREKRWRTGLKSAHYVNTGFFYAAQNFETIAAEMIGANGSANNMQQQWVSSMVEEHFINHSSNKIHQLEKGLKQAQQQNKDIKEPINDQKIKKETL